MVPGYLIPALIVVFLFSLTAGAQTSTSTQFPEISFTVSMSRPHTHLFDVEMLVKRAPGAQIPATDKIIMPVWTPGSYMIREFERHVQDFNAVGADGAILKWEKLD